MELKLLELSADGMSVMPFQDAVNNRLTGCYSTPQLLVSRCKACVEDSRLKIGHRHSLQHTSWNDLDDVHGQHHAQIASIPVAIATSRSRAFQCNKQFKRSLDDLQLSMVQCHA